VCTGKRDGVLIFRRTDRRQNAERAYLSLWADGVRRALLSRRSHERTQLEAKESTGQKSVVVGRQKTTTTTTTTTTATTTTAHYSSLHQVVHATHKHTPRTSVHKSLDVLHRAVQGWFWWSKKRAR
jgi:hypothetical protein